MGRYTDPERNGYLMEAKACTVLEKDLARLIEKYRKRVAKEQADRQAEFEEVMGYRSEADLQEAKSKGSRTRHAKTCIISARFCLVA